MEKIWEKRKGETSKAFNAFCTYRDTPPVERSLQNTCQKLDKKWTSYHSLLRKWSSEHEWVSRSEAWDAYRDQQTEQSRIDKWAEFQENAEKYALLLLGKGARRLIDIENEKIPAVILSKWLQDALKTMRDIRGEPSEISEQRLKVETVKAYITVSPDDWDDVADDEDEEVIDETTIDEFL